MVDGHSVESSLVLGWLMEMVLGPIRELGRCCWVFSGHGVVEGDGVRSHLGIGWKLDVALGPIMVGDTMGGHWVPPRPI